VDGSGDAEVDTAGSGSGDATGGVCGDADGTAVRASGEGVDSSAEAGAAVSRDPVSNAARRSNVGEARCMGPR
jgi:hypothetical protein